MSRIRFYTVLVIVLAGGCGEERDSDSPAELSVASLPGVYAGVFPCEDCPGIASTLWLRSDSRFFFSQQYAADDTREAIDTYSLGRWISRPDDRTIELRGDGPMRTFMRLDGDSLVMQTESDLEHRLIRDLTATDFSATIRMTGVIRMHDGSASFTECLTGFVAPVSKGGDYARFRHQYRSAVRPNKSVFVELKGRFSWSDDGAPKSLTIDRFITVKANGAC